MVDKKKDCALDLQELTRMLREIGLEDDPDWIAVILFVRNIVGRLSILDEEKKASLQKNILNILEENSPSTDRLSKALHTIEEYLCSGFSIQLDKVKQELAEEQRYSDNLLGQLKTIVSDLKGSVDRQTQRMEDFGENTIAEIEADKDPREIVSSIRSSVTHMIQEARKEAQVWEQRAKTLEQSAMFDHLLTDIFNRGVFDNYLQRSVQLHLKKQKPLSLLMIDVDDFKTVNDKWGHQVGDDLLRTLSKIIKSHADMYLGAPCRYGGEELTVIFEDTSESEAAQRAEAIRKDTEKYNFIPRSPSGQVSDPIHFTISVGVASLEKHDWEAHDLIGAADQAMYQAKSHGKNQVVIYSDVACPLSPRAQQ